MKFKHLSEYIRYAYEVLGLYGLSQWKIRWMDINSVRTCGRALLHDRVIELNKDYYFLTPSHGVLIDTILHEIAHAIHFEETGDSDHSEGWKRVCRRIGANPERLNRRAVMPTFATRKVSENRAQFEID